MGKLLYGIIIVYVIEAQSVDKLLSELATKKDSPFLLKSEFEKGLLPFLERLHLSAELLLHLSADFARLKSELATKATKSELEDSATKNDLAELAKLIAELKKDLLKQYVLKSELKDLATKNDLNYLSKFIADLRTRSTTKLKSELTTKLKSEFEKLTTKLKSEFEKLTTKLKSELGTRLKQYVLKTDLATDIENLKTDLATDIENLKATKNANYELKKSAGNIPPKDFNLNYVIIPATVFGVLILLAIFAFFLYRRQKRARVQ